MFGNLLTNLDSANISGYFSDDLIKIGLTFALSFLIGLEREERHNEKSVTYAFGGVRTFPVIGLCGYLAARLFDGSPLALALGFSTIGALLWLSYRKKLELSNPGAGQSGGQVGGMTSEISGLLTFLLGALVYKGAFWAATTLAVITLLLLELKTGLEKLARRIEPGEIFTFTRFLLLSAVILPIVPNQTFTEFNFNPHKIWLIVLAISGLSYVSYGMSKLLGAGRGVLISAFLGGLYSSTFTTVILAKRSRQDQQPRLYVGAMLIASGLMYFRVTALLALFSSELAHRLALPFLVLGAASCLIGWLWAYSSPRSKAIEPFAEAEKNRNPLELQAAALFAFLFVFMTVLTVGVEQSLGKLGVLGLAFLSGVSDVDPFIMSLSQSSAHLTAIEVAAAAVVVATASNNLVKGGYAFGFSAGSVRRQSAIALGLLSAFGFALLFFV